MPIDDRYQRIVSSFTAESRFFFPMKVVGAAFRFLAAGGAATACICTREAGADATARLFAELDAVILKSLRAVQNVMHNDPHCFELYGYDMLIDDSLKPWLIEVNASPSLSATTDDDRDVKLAVIRDALAAAVPESFPFGDPGLDENANSVGSLDLLVDDAADAAARERARERRDRGAGRRARERNGRW